MPATKLAFASTLLLISPAFAGLPAGATLLQASSLPTSSLPTSAIEETDLLVAQTPVGACIVAIQPGSSLNIRSSPTTNSPIIGSLRVGDRVALGVTDGSEGANWTRIITPVEGYVANRYLTNCTYRY